MVNNTLLLILDFDIFFFYLYLVVGLYCACIQNNHYTRKNWPSELQTVQDYICKLIIFVNTLDNRHH